MSTVVGTLQVDVTTGQASFTFDDAKKQLDSFGNSAKDASGKLDYSMREARESVTLTSETLGVHLPGGVARAIAAIGPLGPALEAAMPVVAIIAAIALIIGAIEKYRAAQEKLRLDSMNAGNAIAESLRGLDDKFLQAGIKSDELRGDHLAALTKELKLIDNQTLSDLEHEFETLGKTADTVFNDLKSHWYTTGSGSQHAKYNLDEYEATYRKLLDTKGEPAANTYLKEQVKYEQQILDLQNEVVASKGKVNTDEKYLVLQQQLSELKKAGTGASEKEVEAQKELVDTLNAQLAAQEKINATTSLEKHTDTQESTKKINIEKLKDWEAQSKAALKYRDAVQAAALQEEKRSGKGIGISPEDLASIAAIDPLLAQTLSSTKAENDELSKWQTYLNQVADAEKNVAKAQEDQNTAAKTDAINNQIAAYKRLAEEGLLTERELIAKLKPLYQQETDDKITAIQKEIDEVKAIELAATESADVIRADKAKAEEIKLQAELNKIRQQGVQQQATLDQQANTQWQNMCKQFETGFANSIGKTIVEGRSFGQAMRQVTAQFLEEMISANVKWLISTITTNQARVASTTAAGEEQTGVSIAQDMRAKFSAAKTAAVKAAASVGFPLDLIVAPLVFAAMMAFNKGGLVPGHGNEDTVPAMLTPGEAVLPQPMVAALSTATNASGGNQYHIHYSPTNHMKAWDGSDVKDMLDQHKGEFVKHVEKEIRRRHK